MTRSFDPDGQLNLLGLTRPPDGQTTALIVAKLSGHRTSASWLPAGLFPALDEVRTEHLAIRGRVAADLERLRKLVAKHAAEDAGYRTALSQAHRAGIEPPEDKRTPPDKRAAERDGIEASLWAGAYVLAEVVERARAVLVAHEAEALAELGRVRVEAEEAVREAERRLAEAKAKVWHGVKLGRWLKGEVEGGPLSGQPAPSGDEPMPPGFDSAQHSDAFERQWHERDRVLPVRAPDDPLALEHGEEAVIEPLEESARWSKRSRAGAA